MQLERKHPGIVWRVVTPKAPMLWAKNDDESWVLNPPMRYVITSDEMAEVDDLLESWSDLKGSRFYRPLLGSKDLANKRILVERHRCRGIGDMLFTTAVLRYLQHVNSQMMQIYYYAATDRRQVLDGNEDIFNGASLVGPVIYDTLPLYHAHWFIECATEYDEEPDQSNVYDVLLQQLGIDATAVDPKFKRPFVSLSKSHRVKVDDFMRLIYYGRHEDWRKSPYWVLSPTTHSSLRTANYGMWLELMQLLAEKAHVLVVGQVLPDMPVTDMPFAQFSQEVAKISSSNANVVNLLGSTPISLIAGLIGGAEGLVTLDSGLLYVAEGLRVPAVSIWGPHHPFVRIGYDKDYMDLAVWRQDSCAMAPCFAYRGFPMHKCPNGIGQEVCEPLKAVTATDVMTKVEQVISLRQPVRKIKVGGK